MSLLGATNAAFAQTSSAECAAPSRAHPLDVPLKNPSFTGDGSLKLVDWQATEHVEPGQYVFRTDTINPHTPPASALIRRTGTQTFGFIHQELKIPDGWQGKIARLSGFLRTEEANDAGGGLVIQALDGAGSVRAWDPMRDRLVRQTQPWQEYSVTIVIPPDTYKLRVGAMLQGGGSLWVDDLKLEILE